jgi:hypothetical protein
MGFKPIIGNVRLMDAGMFQTTWGGLAHAIGVD